MAIPSLEQTLQRLATTFTVRDIMIPTEDLTCAPREEDAPAESAKHPDFNVIPIKRGEEITGYYERDSGETKLIVGTHVKVNKFEQRPVGRVETQPRVAGG